MSRPLSPYHTHGPGWILADAQNTIRGVAGLDAFHRGKPGIPIHAFLVLRQAENASEIRRPEDEVEVAKRFVLHASALVDALNWNSEITSESEAQIIADECSPEETNGMLYAVATAANVLREIGQSAQAQANKLEKRGAERWAVWQASEKTLDDRIELWRPFLPTWKRADRWARAETGDWSLDLPGGGDGWVNETWPTILRLFAEVTIAEWKAKRTGFVPATVTVNGNHYAGVAKPVTAIAWSFGAPGEAVDVDGVMFAGSPATRYVPRMMDVTKGGAPAERTLALGLDDTPEPSGTHALALASSALVGGVASKLIILLHTMPEHREGTLGELTRVLMPKNTRYQQRDFERVAEALREVAGLMVYFPNEHTGVELFCMLRPTQSGISYADQRIWTGIHPALLAKLTAPANRWAKGDVLINIDAMMGSPANETLERRVYLVAAGDINDANMKGAEVRHRPVNELVARANMRNRDASSKSMHEAREEVIAAAESLAEKKLIVLDKRGSHGRYEVRLGPTVEHLQAYRKRREGGRR